MSQVAVYQAYDTQDHLLYVGLSKHWPRRWTHHAKQKPWWQEVGRLTIAWLPSHAAARAVEAYLIRHLHPRANRVIPRVTRFDHWFLSSHLSTRCSRCPTWYDVEMRPPGSVCGDLSLPLERFPLTTQWTPENLARLESMGCQGICALHFRGA